MINLRIGGIVAAAFIVGVFVASPELRAYAANTIGSADIIDGSIQSIDIGNGQVKTADLGGNAVTAAKIKDNEIKAAEIATNAVRSSEIATDAVGASEIAGVTKLLFGQCVLSSGEASIQIPNGSVLAVDCIINGVDSDDSAVVSFRNSFLCWSVVGAHTVTNAVNVFLQNNCGGTDSIGSTTIAVIVYDK